MHPHHDAFINIPLAVILGTMHLWISYIETFGWIMTSLIIPLLSAALLIHQIRNVRRK